MAPARSTRLCVAAAIGVLAGGYALWVRLSGHFTFSDFDQLWIGARAVVAGENPYAVVPRQFAWPLFYPMPAVVVSLPFSALPMAWAPAIWIAFGFALLAWALSATGWWPLLLLATNPAVNAMELGQWSPVLTAAALMPSLAWLVVAKPTTGVAIVGAYALERRPRLVVAAIGVAVVAVSFVLRPTWVSDWIVAVRSAHHFVPLVFRTGGWLMLAALLKWRRPEARMLLLLSIVPMTMAAYEAVALFLIPRTKHEIIVFAALTVAAQVGVARTPDGLSFVEWLSRNAVYYFVFLYLPCLIMVLRRPNVRPVEATSTA